MIIISIYLFLGRSWSCGRTSRATGSSRTNYLY